MSIIILSKRRGGSASAPCMGTFRDILGQQFGEWTVVRRANDNYRGSAVWVCRCSCGTERNVVSGGLHSGQSRSCGHVRETAGGLSHKYASEYATWHNMHVRCSDPSHPRYDDWGGRGINVQSRWNSFTAFLEDMGPRPFPAAQLDRINNDYDYCRENCRWVTAEENVRNSSRIRILEHNGFRMSVADWARKLGVKSSLLYSRLHYGCDVGRVLTENIPQEDTKIKTDAQSDGKKHGPDIDPPRRRWAPPRER